MGYLLHSSKLIMLGIAGAIAALSTVAKAQTTPGTAGVGPGKTADVTAVAGCSRPDDAKEAKVVELDTGKSLAKLAVNLGSGRFKLVRITVWDRPEDPRPLIPVIEAARITQGLVQFHTPTLNDDPESAHDSFLLMADMGGGTVCWATPASLVTTKSQGQLSGARSAAEPPPSSEATAEKTGARATAASQTPESPPAPELGRSRSRTIRQTNPQ
jgi:hypothetical protein